MATAEADGGGGGSAAAAAVWAKGLAANLQYWKDVAKTGVTDKTTFCQLHKVLFDRSRPLRRCFFIVDISRNAPRPVCYLILVCALLCSSRAADCVRPGRKTAPGKRIVARIERGLQLCQQLVLLDDQHGCERQRRGN